MRTNNLLCGRKYVVCINALKFSVGFFHPEHLYIAKQHINLRLFAFYPKNLLMSLCFIFINIL